MRIIWIVPLVAGLGCLPAEAPRAKAGAVPAEWRTDLRKAKKERRPLLVLSILGDLEKRC